MRIWHLYIYERRAEVKGKMESLIVKAQPKKKDLPFHHVAGSRKEVGPSYHCMNKSLVPEADIYVDVNHVEQIPVGSKYHIEPHKHPVSSVFTIIGDLTVEVILDGVRHEVQGPASIFIPSGTMHMLRPIKGKGCFVVIMTGGNYVVST
jgi:mannose-6-phosphate isomerase-like protein (cupin superfamily)